MCAIENETMIIFCILPNPIAYLPAGLGVSIIHKVVLDPGVYCTERHFVIVGAHRHTNESCVRKWRLVIPVGAVVLRAKRT